jgi:hypothetical protein
MYHKYIHYSNTVRSLRHTFIQTYPCFDNDSRPLGRHSTEEVLVRLPNVPKPFSKFDIWGSQSSVCADTSFGYKAAYSYQWTLNILINKRQHSPKIQIHIPKTWLFYYSLPAYNYFTWNNKFITRCSYLVQQQHICIVLPVYVERDTILDKRNWVSI